MERAWSAALARHSQEERNLAGGLYQQASFRRRACKGSHSAGKPGEAAADTDDYDVDRRGIDPYGSWNRSRGCAAVGDRGNDYRRAELVSGVNVARHTSRVFDLR